MATISVKAIITFSRDTTANWNRHPRFIPKVGEAIVYSDHSSYVDENGSIVYVPGIKIGDGNAYLVDLPFVGETGYSGPSYDAVMRRIEEHENNTIIHVTQADRDRWDNKLSYQVSGDTLILTTN